jgi:hypothetical protein
VATVTCGSEEFSVQIDQPFQASAHGRKIVEAFEIVERESRNARPKVARRAQDPRLKSAKDSIEDDLAELENWEDRNSKKP